MNKSKAIITDNYTVKKEKIMGITVWMYIPKEEKEKDPDEMDRDFSLFFSFQKFLMLL